jgi:hypothetical protein
VPADELEKATNFAKGRFVLQLESPQGLIMFGLRREVLEGAVVEPDEVLARDRRRYARGRAERGTGGARRETPCDLR